jgi:hypothetical protein
MKYSNIYLTGLLMLCILNLSAQKSPQETKADKFYERLAFKRALSLYLESEGLSIQGLRRTAESYRNLGDFVNAEKYYTKFMEQGEFTDEDIYSYALVLRSVGKYTESDKWMRDYADRHPKDNRVKEYLRTGKTVLASLKDDGRYKITNLEINSSRQDFGTCFFGDKIVFTSSNDVAVRPIKRTYSWNEKPFLDMFVANVSDAGQLTEVKSLNENHKRELNKRMHEGPACFALDGTLMAFTRNDYSGKSKEGEVKLQIFFSEFIDGVWQKETHFKLNNSEYSVGHPWLSQDAKTMYFVSDMPGGYGGTDIYRIEKKSGGEWGDPVNMGAKINTEGNEMFPFIEEKFQYMFFSSDGHTGLGGLDVYMAVMKNYAIGKVVNMGASLNSPYDDFALIVDKDMKKGYFSSNREGGKGDDDIYHFEILKPFRFSKKIIGKATDNYGNLVSGADIELYDSDGLQAGTTETDDDGVYAFMVDADDKTYYVQAKKSKYESGKSQTLSTATVEDEFTLNVSLVKIPEFKFICRVKDKESNEPLSSVKIKINNKVTGEKQIYETQWSGEFSKMLDGYKLNDRVYIEIIFEKEGYQPKTVIYDNRLVQEGEYIVSQSLEAIVVEAVEVIEE